MKKMTSLRMGLALACMAVVGLNALAQSGETAVAEPSMLYAPLVYDNYDNHAVESPIATAKSSDIYQLDAGDQWLQQAIDNSNRTHQARQRVMIENPQLVAYNANSLAVAPPEGVIPSDPRQGMLTIAHPPD